MSADNQGPKSSEKTIQEHLRYYYSQLQTSAEFTVSSLFNSYLQIRPSLHKFASSSQTDVSTLSYAVSRLPPCIYQVKKIIISQGLEQLTQAGINIDSWELQSASARRRQNYYDHVSQTLVVLINSDSDVDDFINCLIAFQIERQKFSKLNPHEFSQVLNNQKYSLLGIEQDEWTKFTKIIGGDLNINLNNYYKYTDIIVHCLPLNEKHTINSVQSWWQKVAVNSLIFDFNNSPLYFVSSNLHSLTNLVGGFANQRQDSIIDHIRKNYPDLNQQWENIKGGDNQLRVIDFLYYASSKYFHDFKDELVAKNTYESNLGIKKLKINSQLPCEVQLIPVSAISKSKFIDPNLIIKDPLKLQNSQAYILNIEYPLGLLAYYILQEIQNTLQQLKGVYIVGKAAILSGAIGDIQIPKAVFDERLNNIFFPNNVFNHYFPFTSFQSSILQNQKAISVYGTYLENETQLNNYTSAGFNIIEMETGPYLTAIYQHQNKIESIPQNVVASLDQLPFDLGIINYASDNPLSQTLGDSVMSLRGVEPTYLAALTIIQRIIDLESS